MKTTNDCKLFLCEWFRARGGSEIFGSIEDLKEQYDTDEEAEDFYKQLQLDVINPKKWSRHYKRKEDGLIKRGFFLDNKVYDSQVGYEVLEDSLGNLTLGEYIGD